MRPMTRLSQFQFSRFHRHTHARTLSLYFCGLCITDVFSFSDDRTRFMLFIELFSNLVNWMNKFNGMVVAFGSFRSVGRTQMNEQSSRSHFVFTLRISGVNEVL